MRTRLLVLAAVAIAAVAVVAASRSLRFDSNLLELQAEGLECRGPVSVAGSLFRRIVVAAVNFEDEPQLRAGVRRDGEPLASY